MIPYSLKRRACRAYRSRSLQIKLLESLLHLQGHAIKVQVSRERESEGLRWPRSFKEATGVEARKDDFPVPAAERIERRLHAAYRFIVGR